MRNKQKKIYKQHGPTKIQQLELKAENISGLLQQERERIRLENEKKGKGKERKEQIRKERLTKEQKKKKN